MRWGQVGRESDEFYCSNPEGLLGGAGQWPSHVILIGTFLLEEG